MFALFSLTLGAISEDDIVGQFKQYLTTFNKTTYSSMETLERFQNFKASDLKIKELNAMRTSDTAAKFGHTYYSDYSSAEFSNMLGYQRVSKLGNIPVAKDFKGVEYGNMASVDWRNEGKVTAVKNQADCGSCWAFSAVEGVESAALMQNLGCAGTKLSEQQVVSCDTTSYGCQGGDLISAFDYIQGAGGLDSEASYPYTSGTDDDSGTCRNIADYVKGTDISSYTYATSPCNSGSCNNQNENNLASTLSSKGPISICLNASQWQYYTGGVMTTSQCGGGAADQMDHCVQLVGMQTSQDYWIVRNSWSTGWGEDGYIYLEMGGNTCGLANEALYVTLPSA